MHSLLLVGLQFIWFFSSNWGLVESFIIRSICSAVFRIRIRTVFKLPGSRSVTRRYGPWSGSFHPQAKIVKKRLISIPLWFLYDFLSLKNDVNLFQKVISKENWKEKDFVDVLEVTDGKSRIRSWIGLERDPNPDSLVRGTDPPKMSQIRLADCVRGSLWLQKFTFFDIIYSILQCVSAVQFVGPNVIS